MKKSFSTFFILSALALVFFASTFLSNQYLRGFSVDLTEDKMYSLSSGSEAIIENLDTPITLNLFFSDETSKGMSSLRNYAMQVKTLLKKYDELGADMIELNIIDPRPFSEQEDRAAEFGLTAAALGPAQESVYFGLAGLNQNGDAMIIGFFDPAKSGLLEYDISRLIYQLSEPEAIKLTVITDIALAGEQNPVTGRVTPAFVVYQQLNEFFDLDVFAGSDDVSLQDTDVLLIAHPQNFSEELLFRIDQYLLAGGKAIILYDPHFESEAMSMMGAMGANASNLPLLSHYGLDTEALQVVLDSQTGLEIRTNAGDVIRHLGFLGLQAAQINASDVVTGDLESINGASFGKLKLQEESALVLTPLLSSSIHSDLIQAELYANAQDPAILNDQFIASGVQKVLAGRLNGRADSYFSQDESRSTQADFIAQTDNLNIMLVADADFLADRFWVQQSNFFGQPMYSPFANNADFIVNAIENYGGAEELIGLRSKGSFSRPFERVQNIAVEAEAKFREQERRLQAELAQTEQQLAQLQSQQVDGVSLTFEQEQAIDEFIAKRIETRKALRDVQFQLDKDISTLGTQLKLINIVIAPLVLTLLLFLCARLLRARAPKPSSMT